MRSQPSSFSVDATVCPTAGFHQPSKKCRLSRSKKIRGIWGPTSPVNGHHEESAGGDKSPPFGSLRSTASGLYAAFRRAKGQNSASAALLIGALVQAQPSCLNAASEFQILVMWAILPSLLNCMT